MELTQNELFSIFHFKSVISIYTAHTYHTLQNNNECSEKKTCYMIFLHPILCILKIFLNQFLINLCFIKKERNLISFAFIFYFFTSPFSVFYFFFFFDALINKKLSMDLKRFSLLKKLSSIVFASITIFT